MIISQLHKCLQHYRYPHHRCPLCPPTPGSATDEDAMESLIILLNFQHSLDLLSAVYSPEARASNW